MKADQDSIQENQEVLSDSLAQEDSTQIVQEPQVAIPEKIVKPIPTQEQNQHRSDSDEIKELKERLSKFENLLKIGNETDILDKDIVVDLMSRGWTIQDLRNKKPYLFKQSTDPVPQEDASQKPKPDRIIAPMQTPKQKSEITEADDFVKSLVDVLKTESF